MYIWNKIRLDLGRFYVVLISLKVKLISKHIFGVVKSTDKTNEIPFRN